MESVVPIIMFLLIMSATYIVTISRWGFLERRVARSNARHAQILSDCALLSDARAHPAAQDNGAESGAVAGDRFDISLN